jgi:hypothetical protein
VPQLLALLLFSHLNPSKGWECVTKALFFHKKQLEVLDNQMKALIKKKKEKENVLTYLELINMKNVSLL